jgi:hypothetical protein
MGRYRGNAVLRRAARRFLDGFPQIGRALRDYRDLRDRQALVWARIAGHDFEILGGNWMAAGAEQHEHFELSPHSPDGAVILLRCRGDSDRIINRLTWIVRGRHGEPNG